jgi:hypothetical protein
MEKNGRIIEVRSREGGLLFSILINEKPVQLPEESKERPTGKTDDKSKNNDGTMTDAQQRFLFRLLAEQGKEGEEAHQHLKTKIFQVNSLKEVTKSEASQAIERLLSEQKGGTGK